MRWGNHCGGQLGPAWTSIEASLEGRPRSSVRPPTTMPRCPQLGPPFPPTPFVFSRAQVMTSTITCLRAQGHFPLSLSLVLGNI